MEEDGPLHDGELVLEAGDEALRPQERRRLQPEELDGAEDVVDAGGRRLHRVHKLGEEGAHRRLETLQIAALARQQLFERAHEKPEGGEKTLLQN